MTVVQPAPGVGLNKPTCTHKVRLSKVRTGTRAWRERIAREKGRPADVCGRRATHLINGEPRCFAHAGQEALRILSEVTG